jgi:N-acetylglucosamine-6-phosphate deacetylase
VTSFQPTLITAPEDDLVAASHEVPSEPIGPRILGVHLEGPFLSEARIGAHPLHARRDPDVALAERLLAAGPVTYMTLAPELDGAVELIDALHARGVVVSCGHSDATAAEAARAFDRGVATVTHLFNAMRPFHHREPGIAGAALARDDVVVQVILDGVHLAEDTARFVYAAARGRIALVTDAIAAAGVGDGVYDVGGLEVTVTDGVPRIAGGGSLAGSTLTMDAAFRNLVRNCGLTIREAVTASATRPAAVLGLAEETGALSVGLAADLVVLDQDLRPKSVLARGEWVKD